MSTPSYNAWKLVSLSPLPTWALGGLCALLALGVLLAALGLRREPSRSRRVLLWTFRGLAGLAALFFLLEPGVRDLQVAQVKNRVAILVDRSASMTFPVEAGGSSRAEQASEYLRSIGSDLEGLSDRFTFETFGFSPQLSPLPVDADSRPPLGARTDLLGALRQIQTSDGGGAGRGLSGVLLLSDGTDNVDLADGLSGRERTALRALGVPVSTFVVGKDGLADVAIEQVRVDDFAFVRNSFTVDVEVRGRGFAGREVPVVLRREGEVVASRTVRFEGRDDVQALSFQLTPDQTGRFVFTVEVPAYPEEAVTENNTRAFVLKVIRDRVRVLLVVGRPTWDERFLRGLLKQDANVDLVSFYILRTQADDPNVRDQERELSLIPFPMQEIFDTRLDTFDVVIFQNFGYADQTLSIAFYERNLERYVHNGGAMVMIGGDRSFGEGRASFHTLGQALPVESLGLPANVELFRPRLTADGIRHPITALGAGPSASQALWNGMPALPGANVTRLREGATALLEHSAISSGGESVPIAAVWDYGRGRAMALTVDSSWYWAFTANRAGAPTRLYDRFWSNALRWLVRDPDLTTLRVIADPPSVEPGNPIGAVVEARTPDYQPAPGAEVEVELYSVNERRVVERKGAAAGEDGVARVEFTPPSPGPYKIVGTAKKDGRDLGRGEDALAVRAVGQELSDASVRGDLLAEIARATGGRSYRLPQRGLPDVPLIDPPVVEVGRSKDRPLWDRWYYLVVLAGLLGGEWLLRRRFGYV